jgi:hypothetical protein
MNWLQQRWAEPESRAAAAAAFGAVAAELSGKIDVETMVLSVVTAALAFVFPAGCGARR